MVIYNFQVVLKGQTISLKFFIVSILFEDTILASITISNLYEYSLLIVVPYFVCLI